MAETSAGKASTSGRESEYFANYAATTIQRRWRGFRVRRVYLAKKREIAALQTNWKQRKQQANIYDWAARIVQTAWRSYRNKRIYRYYRDLIQFRERGDPKELLRCINPREAQLVDAASGIHVRFRLGGTTFPPLVFYKIFTHRPVTDICAFGPRDYASEVRVTASELHNKPSASSSSTGMRQPKKPHTYKEGDFDLDETLREYIKPDGTIGLRSTKGWYERIENNGWRPISERVLLEEDPVTTMTRLKRQPLFHYNPGVRREEKVRKAKQKKREWLMKMYRDGMLGKTGNNPDGGAPDDDFDLSALDDDELDEKAGELLDWAQHLDFNTYVGDWTSMACTLGSEAFVPEDELPYLSEIPGPPKSLATAMYIAGAPSQPFKGGVTAACSSTSTMPLN